MLLKIEKTILRKVLKQPYENHICISQFKGYCGADVNQAFISLKEKGYFERIEASCDFSSFTYVLSSQGRYYREYAFRNLLKNIIIPFIVALLTTIATLYLEKLVENNHPAYTSECTSDYSCQD